MVPKVRSLLSATAEIGVICVYTPINVSLFVSLISNVLIDFDYMLIR